MNLVAIDTATEKFSVALAVVPAGNPAGERWDTWLFEADAGMRHSELVMDCLDMLMGKARIGPQDLGGVLCMGGPGSFTGLRIGFSLAKGLALSLGIPFVPISTLDCLARPLVAWPGIVVPVLDAKKKAFFCALYRDGKRSGPDMDASPGEIALALAKNVSPQTGKEPLEQAVLVGPGAEMLYRELMLIAEDDPGIAPTIRHGKGVRWGNAETLLEIALETGIFDKDGHDAGNHHNLFAGPEYMRKSDAELNLEPSAVTTTCP
ncbi:MAG: tRNA (adenosine(37)-N6)-threonylcarbamoyltransferase complex dimerization subunit type 1 TsaB [Treponema sp.]|nr:tRNA (adenosine(37)-N6)-threonylcarbamoyltransferase complex dimerization subunit type 1 TsaB [Treponema sp.]